MVNLRLVHLFHDGGFGLIDVALGHGYFFASPAFSSPG